MRLIALATDPWQWRAHGFGPRWGFGPGGRRFGPGFGDGPPHQVAALWAGLAFVLFLLVLAAVVGVAMGWRRRPHLGAQWVRPTASPAVDRPLPGNSEALPPLMPPPVVRLSHAERHRAADHVSLAMGEGRLDSSEGRQRLAEVYAARYRHDLDKLTWDIPPFPPAVRATHPRPGLSSRDGLPAKIAFILAAVWLLSVGPPHLIQLGWSRWVTLGAILAVLVVSLRHWRAVDPEGSGQRAG